MIHENNGHDAPSDNASGSAGGEAAAETPADAAQPGAAVNENDPRGSGEEAEPEASAPLAPEAQIAGLEAEVADLKDKLMRAVAEMDNLRKRMEREVAGAAKYSISAFAKDIIGLTDNFQRALDVVPVEEAEADPAMKGLRDGVVLTEAEFIKVLDRHGIKRLQPERGKDIFDPNFHQAISQVQDASVPAGTVIEVFQPGFKLDTRILRPALVVVAQGGMKPVKDAPAAASGASQLDAPDTETSAPQQDAKPE